MAKRLKNPAGASSRQAGSGRSRGAIAPSGGRAHGPEKPTRKNHYLNQSKIDLAKMIPGVATETEALGGALDALIYGEALAQRMERAGLAPGATVTAPARGDPLDRDPFLPLSWDQHWIPCGGDHAGPERDLLADGLSAQRA